jgi:hypothetical protein
VEEHVDGDDVGTDVGGGDVGEVSGGGFEDDGGKWVGGLNRLAEVDGEGCADACAVEDDGIEANGAGEAKVDGRGLGVVAHGVLRGVLAGAEAVAAVVEDEDVEVGGVEVADDGERLGEAAVAVA